MRCPPARATFGSVRIRGDELPVSAVNRLGEFGGTPRRGQRRTSPSAHLQWKQRFHSRSLCAESVASSFLAASADIGKKF
ncbi:hypothetical protein DV515_00004760 [Chloebia gouldiae]|uniref:Uncharacterized protein n=1 Tax=Chloebia gouldiae TaxID=44316 RepID=A0A3L8SPD2_CHLGU|nr:hypothetical protein DV515_00004760 [Chloebia gouldiae]